MLVASLAAAQFVPAPTNLTTKEGYAGVNVRYKQVPAGICELDPNVKSYSGYADVGKDQHVFWWFFESRNQDPSEAPLTVWVSTPPLPLKYRMLIVHSRLMADLEAHP